MNEEKIGKLKNWSRISIKGEVQSLKKKKKKLAPQLRAANS
jgi:hypothetical protein